MQDRPICFQCKEAVQTNAELIFESPCGHDTCVSAVFHPLCLFDWRERRQKWTEMIQEIRQRWIEEHQRHQQEEGDRDG